jgi:hypothetical protein
MRFPGVQLWGIAAPVVEMDEASDPFANRRIPSISSVRAP